MAEAFLTTEFTQDAEDWRKEFLKTSFNKFEALEEKIYNKQ